MADLIVVVPTRGRPQRCAELLDTMRQTCVSDTGTLLAVDFDDPDLPAYRELAEGYVRVGLVVVDEPGGHVGAINAAAMSALEDYEPYAIAKLDDDHRPRTRAWDKRYLAALYELGSGIVYGNDLLQGERLPTVPAMTADIVRTLGFYAPPSLRHLYCDNFWRDLGTEAGCLRYLPDVVVEHMHAVAGKAPWDEGYARANSQRRYTEDGNAYNRYRWSEQFTRDVIAVQALRGVPTR